MEQSSCGEAAYHSPSQEILLRLLWEWKLVMVFPLLAGLAGHVNIDTNGDRIADYSLLDMDPVTNTFHVSTRFRFCIIGLCRCSMDVTRPAFIILYTAFHLLLIKVPDLLNFHKANCFERINCLLIATDLMKISWLSTV